MSLEIFIPEAQSILEYMERRLWTGGSQNGSHNISSRSTMHGIYGKMSMNKGCSVMGLEILILEVQSTLDYMGQCLWHRGVWKLVWKYLF